MADDRRNVSVENLGLSTRALNALRMSQVRTVGDIHTLGAAELLRLPNLGRVSAAEIHSALRRLGCPLRGSVRPRPAQAPPHERRSGDLIAALIFGVGQCHALRICGPAEKDRAVQIINDMEARFTSAIIGQDEVAK